MNFGYGFWICGKIIKEVAHQLLEVGSDIKGGV
jgi:hypothetical protein